MRPRQPAPPERLGHDLEIIRNLLEIARACGFALWVDDGQLSVRAGLQGGPERLYWAEAGALVLLWRLARRAGELVDALPVRKPAARAAAASAQFRRRA